jgi:hypothetical protein
MVVKANPIRKPGGVLDAAGEPEDLLQGDSALNMLFRNVKIVPKGAEFVTASGRVLYLDEKSIYLFKGDNALRNKLVKFVSWHVFDKFIILVIIINAVFVGLQDYSYRLYLEEDFKTEYATVQEYNQRLTSYENIFTFIFIFECIAKIIAQGFYQHKNAYLKSNWNTLDFLIVIVLLVEMMPF